MEFWEFQIVTWISFATAALLSLLDEGPYQYFGYITWIIFMVIFGVPVIFESWRD